MKILFINNFFTQFGGAENIMLKEALLLQQDGHEAFFFAADRKPYLIENYSHAEFFPKFLDYRGLPKSEALKNLFRPFYNIEAKRNLIKMIEKIRPDVIHIHNIHYHLTPSVLEALKKFNIPVIMTIHDTRLMCPAGTFSLNAQKPCIEKLCIKGNFLPCIKNKCKNSNLKESLITALEFAFNRTSNLYGRVDCFITPSTALLNLAIETGILASKLIHINNFADDDFFKSPPVYGKESYFLYAGRLSKEKGLDTLLETAVKLPEASFKIAGSGPTENYHKKKALFMKLKNVEFLGHQTKEEIISLYKNAFAGILPCKWFEIFGLSTVEAFACGKPVIASNLCAIPEIIDEGLNGLLFEAGNSQQLAEKVGFLIQNKAVVSDMGKNALAKAQSEYTEKVHYRKLLDLYRRFV